MISKNTNIQGFSIVLAMGIVLIFSLIGLYLLEYMVPFSRSVRGIENASESFYQSYGGVEKSLQSIYGGTVGANHNDLLVGNSDYSYSFTGSSDIIPIAGNGDSAIDQNYSQLSATDPISIPIGNNALGGGTNRIELNLRIPDFDGDGNGEALSSYNDLVLWQVSSQSNSLSARDLLDLDPILKSESVNLLTLNGLELGDTLADSGRDFDDFYTNNCIAGPCILRISIIDILETNNGGILPYLEYQILSNDPFPLPKPTVFTRGRSFGFSKDLEVGVPISTTSSAFDFTVLQ